MTEPGGRWAALRSTIQIAECYGIALDDLERAVTTLVRVLGAYYITWEAYL